MRPSKRDELVQKAEKIFYRDGFHATGMDRLVAETGISKTTMFKHFHSKDELILATLRRKDETFRNRMHKHLAEAGGEPREQLLAVFDVLTDWFAQADFCGCMFIKAASEYPVHDDPIAVQAREHKRLVLLDLQQLARAAGAGDAAGLARQLMLLIEGAIVAKHMGYSEAPDADAKAAAEVLIMAA
ncbi:TetR family transcriptional regulator [Roseibium hamelinense]|uniref:TetR family transcriptional regulator n=1 Tax=Roseibium hamelinense TaxID=150831 RepID=A0A562T7S2_9HYPH|nr:TetR/AcrR family transcriptional regulator [Roseibium hamelinense]MTI42340.1 TetR/AcrR family transcriptional regulator [Roseibium hamelinense]TWI89572.1 TetR family transcriptional regulator [Roseibium hamelinense]